MNTIKLFKVIGFLKGLYFYIPIFTLFLVSKDISISAAVFAQGIYSLTTFLGEVPTGIFADKFGQKTSIIVGYLLEAAGIALVLCVPTTWGLYAAFGLRGFSSSFLSGSEEALLFESVKAERKTEKYQKVYASFLSNEQAGFIVAAAVAGLAYGQWSDKAFMPLILLTALAVGVAGILALFIKSHNGLVQNQAEGSGMFSILSEGFALIRKNTTIFTLTLVAVLTIGAEYFLQGVYQPYFENNHVPALWIGLVLSLGAVLNMIATRYVYLLEKYLSVEKILLLVNVALGLAYIGLAMIVHPAFLVGVYILMNGLFNLERPVVSDYINSRTPSKIRTTVLSGISFIRRFVQIFLTSLLAWIVGIWGIQASLTIQGIYLLVGISIGYYLLIRCGCTYKVRNAEGEIFEFGK